MFKLLTLIVALLVFTACDPERERFPGGNGRTTEVEQADSTKAVLGGFDPMKPKFQEQAGGGGAVDPAKSVHGVIKLGRKVVVKESMMFSVAARSIAGGPPLAVLRMPRPDFPFEFTLSQANSMTGAPFEGLIEVTARLDQDGDPLTHQEGDFKGSVKTKVGDQKIEINLDQPADKD